MLRAPAPFLFFSVYIIIMDLDLVPDLGSRKASAKGWRKAFGKAFERMKSGIICRRLRRTHPLDAAPHVTPVG